MATEHVQGHVLNVTRNVVTFDRNTLLRIALATPFRLSPLAWL